MKTISKEKRKKENIILKCWNNFDKIYNKFKLFQLSILLSCALFVLDYFDVPSLIVSTIPREIFFLTIIVGVMFVLTWLKGNHYFDLFRVSSENILDAGLIVTIITSLLYSIYSVIILTQNIYVNIAIATMLMALIIFGIRFGCRCHKYKQIKDEKSNLIDLKQLFENNFKRRTKKPILLSEKDVGYDLFDRDSIVKKLYSSITHCQPEKSYVISLEGKWGTGKTTIINRTKQYLNDSENNEDEYIIIDDFDPWLYGTQDALLLGMLETIVKHAGIKYSPIKNNLLAKEIGKTVTESHPVGGLLYNIFYNTKTHMEDVAKLKNQLSTYLHTLNKKVVFIIDNLDRANSDNVIFLFKLIGIVFDLPGIIYVLSFERERINKILQKTDEFDPRFTEKIIQQEIQIPSISEEKLEEVYLICIENLLSAYSIPKSHIIEFAPVARYIVEKSEDIRSFKRMVNSVFSIVFCDDSILDKRDLLALELVHFYTPELYDSIYRNSQYFISHDRNPENYFLTTYNKDKFNQEAKSYYDSIFEQRDAEKKLLAEIFPYIKRYSDGNEVLQNHVLADPDAKEIAKKSRACNGKYFDLYFSYTSNNSLKIQKNTKEFVSLLNSTEDLQSAIMLTEDAIFSMSPDLQREWIERFQNHIDDIQDNRVFFAAISLYSSIHSISDITLSFGMGLTPRNRTSYILSELLLRCDEEEFNNFLQEIEMDFNKLYIIDSICYWIESDIHINRDNRVLRLEKLKTKYNNMRKKIIDDKINLYADEHYQKNNIWGLYHYFKDSEDLDGFICYIKNVLTSESVYRILWDIIGHSVSYNHSYAISQENMSAFGITSDIISGLITQHPPRNDDEAFVLSVFEAFNIGEADLWGKKSIVTTTPFNPSL